jgi:hypothetical protein
MKLLDPLMGYKLASGISVIHFAFYIVILTLPEPSECTQASILDSIDYLKKSHLLTTIILSYVFLIDYESNGVSYMCSSFLTLISIIVYLFSVFYS